MNPIKGIESTGAYTKLESVKTPNPIKGIESFPPSTEHNAVK